MLRIRDSYRMPGKSPVTTWLIILNVLAFMAASTSALGYPALQVGGLIPAQFGDPEIYFQELARLSALGALEVDRPPGLVTVIWYTFLHAGFGHLFTNMVTLAIFGPNVEKGMGSARFLLFYFSCAAVGVLFQVLVNIHSVIPIIGASGAVTGMFGAYFSLYPQHDIRVTLGTPRHNFYRDYLVPVKRVLLVWLLIEVINGLWPDPNGPKVANFTHLGGLICGFFLARGKLKMLKSTRPDFKVFRGGKSG